MSITVFVCAQPSIAQHVVCFTGGFSERVRFDADTLAVAQGSVLHVPPFLDFQPSGDLSFDETGRLFGVHGQRLFEIDPISLDIVNERLLPERRSNVEGIIARAGKLYGYTGVARLGEIRPELVVFDLDTLEVVAGEIGSHLAAAAAGFHLTFGDDGRLFGVESIDRFSSSQQPDVLVEFDPETLEEIRRKEVSVSLFGIAASSGRLFSLAGGEDGVVAFDQDSLGLVDGELREGYRYSDSITTDTAGRLFVLSRDELIEVDPLSLETVNARSYSGWLWDIAVTDVYPAESLRPISAVAASAAGIQITIPQARQREIGIEYSPDLSPGSWIELGNFAPLDLRTDVYLDQDEARRARRSGFYRAFLRPLAR